MRRAALGLGVLGWVVVVGACGASDPAFGRDCAGPAECPAGVCADIGELYLACTLDCAADADCAVAAWTAVCGDAGYCMLRCSDGITRGEGAARELCVDGHLLACADQDPVTACGACGCEPFGGGVCRPGRGCVPEQPDGASCTDDVECASGRCYADSRVCGAPRADGEACVEAGDCASATCLSDGLCGDARPIGGDCRVDADCETSNCNTNGDETRVGQCMMALGEVCEASSPCQRCTTPSGGAPLGSFETGRCMRSGCDPDDAPNCPRFGGHTFSCARSVEDTYHCYEQCTPDPRTGRTDDHDCWSTLGFCDGGRMFCR